MGLLGWGALGRDTRKRAQAWAFPRTTAHSGGVKSCGTAAGVYLLLTLCTWGGVHGTGDERLGAREAHRRLQSRHSTTLREASPWSNCSAHPGRPSLTWPGILRIGRAPPGNRGDMKGWKKWVGINNFHLILALKKPCSLFLLSLGVECRTRASNLASPLLLQTTASWHSCKRREHVTVPAWVRPTTWLWGPPLGLHILSRRVSGKSYEARPGRGTGAQPVGRGWHEGSLILRVTDLCLSLASTRCAHAHTHYGDSHSTEDEPAVHPQPQLWGQWMPQAPIPERSPVPQDLVPLHR